MAIYSEFDFTAANGTSGALVPLLRRFDSGALELSDGTPRNDPEWADYWRAPDEAFVPANDDPGAHVEHAAAPLAADQEPGPQNEHEAEPGADANEPGAQALHAAALVPPVVERAVPAGHAVQAVAPAVAYVPTAHTGHVGVGAGVVKPPDATSHAVVTLAKVE